MEETFKSVCLGIMLFFFASLVATSIMIYSVQKEATSYDVDISKGIESTDIWRFDDREIDKEYNLTYNVYCDDVLLYHDNITYISKSKLVKVRIPIADDRWWSKVEHNEGDTFKIIGHKLLGDGDSFETLNIYYKVLSEGETA